MMGNCNITLFEMEKLGSNPKNDLRHAGRLVGALCDIFFCFEQTANHHTVSQTAFVFSFLFKSGLLCSLELVRNTRPKPFGEEYVCFLILLPLLHLPYRLLPMLILKTLTPKRDTVVYLNSIVARGMCKIWYDEFFYNCISYAFVH